MASWIFLRTCSSVRFSPQKAKKRKSDEDKRKSDDEADEEEAEEDAPKQKKTKTASAAKNVTAIADGIQAAVTHTRNLEIGARYAIRKLDIE